MADLPIYLWALLLAAVLGIPAVTGVVLYRAADIAGLGRRARTGVASAFAAGWGGWLLVTGYLASAGVYSARGGPWFLVAVAGALVLLLLASRIPLVAGLVSDPRISALLVLPHMLRVLGVVFLILMIQGQLPAVFAVPAGLGDIAIGVAAPFLARRLARGRAARHAAVRFHVLGILDLVVAAGIAALVTSGLLDVTLHRPVTAAPARARADGSRATRGCPAHRRSPSAPHRSRRALPCNHIVSAHFRTKLTTEDPTPNPRI